MSYIEFAFLPFLGVVLGAYYLVPPRFKYLILLVASYFFYGFHNYKIIPILLLVTLLTYFGGLLIENKKSAKVYWIFFASNLLILFLLKYLNFSISVINSVMLRFGAGKLSSVDIVTPIGLSFYVFQSTTYLSDIYRKGLTAEKNFFRYATFVSFFPVILSGPIQKSRELLPQFKHPNVFSSEIFIRGFLLFIYGYFEKVAVSNKLKTIVDLCWNDWDNCTGLKPIIAAVAFSLYIYCDFSSYSDMACGVSRMLGFKVKNNFNNPYLATSLAEFWNRWHMTLNDWFIENVYIPLGGNRKSTVRKYINVMAVFFFSGAWHGAATHFVAWGVINGLLQIIGQILKPGKERFYKAINVNSGCFSIRFIKRVGVFIIITFTWIFFRAPAGIWAINMIQRIFSTKFIDIFDRSLLSISGSVVKTMLCIVMTTIFLLIQYHRKDGNRYYNAFRAQPAFFQALFTGFAIFVVIMASVAGTASVNTDFIYFQF